MSFTGARSLAAFLAGSEETHSAFVEQLFHYLVKQPIRAFGSQELTELRDFFAASRLQHPQAHGRDHRQLGLDAAPGQTKNGECSDSRGRGTVRQGYSPQFQRHPTGGMTWP